MTDLNTAGLPLSGPAAVLHTRLCLACGMDIPSAATRCKTCKAPQQAKPCRVCGAYIDRQARFCVDCKSYQDFRRSIPANALVLSLVASILSLTGLLAPQFLKFLDLRSKTSGFYLETRIDGAASGSDQDSVIFVTIENDGLRPASVERASLDLGTPRISVTELEILNREAMTIPPRSSRQLKLFAESLAITDWPANEPREVMMAAKAKLGQDLCTANPTLSVFVVEHGRLGNREQARNIGPLPFVKRAARKWVFERAEGDDPGDCS